MPQVLLASILGVLLIAPLKVKAEFYTFKENSNTQWQDPTDLFSEFAKTTTDLLSWLQHSEARPAAGEKYNRLKHFGVWVDDTQTPDCYDTRALILIRDSQEDVTFSNANPCKVYSGIWKDPYSGRIIKLARGIEVDHVVALKNAYDSGAYGWDFQHRCLFANFMGFDRHLIAASAEENSSKSDGGPDRWMPSDQNYACQHLQNWLVIKFIWNLSMSAEEADAIELELQENNCSEKVFQYSKAEVARIRRLAQEQLNLCVQ